YDVLFKLFLFFAYFGNAPIADDPEHHQANITGIATLQPVDETIELFKNIYPDVKNIGIVWNTAEACSEACTEMIRKSVKSRDIKLTEITVTNTSQVMMAVQGLVSKGIDAIIVSGDNTVLTGMDTVIAVATENNIPVITNTPPDAEIGALFGLGADYYTVGVETGRLAVRVMKGEKTSEIPIQRLVPEKLWINKGVAKKLNIKLSEKVLNRADKIFE
ncbi:MAG: ABC transporter substrate-binding protein, partial [Candidatus Cloacimonetes bacterium]|nr:ABC transporter substrate-binding protein [Candidatus Cloacimonadota bacterium]